MDVPPLRLGLEDFGYRDLHDPAGLARLSQVFEAGLAEDAPALLHALRTWRGGTPPESPPERSGLLLDLAPHVDRFLARLFRVEAQADARQARVVHEMDTVFAFRAAFVKSRATRQRPVDSGPAETLGQRVRAMAAAARQPETTEADEEQQVCALGAWLVKLRERTDDGESLAPVARERLHQVRRAARGAGSGEDGPADTDPPGAVLAHLVEIVQAWVDRVRDGSLSTDPAIAWAALREAPRNDFSRLVDFETVPEGRDGELEGPRTEWRERDGFELTDRRAGTRDVLYEVDHCIYCHDRDRDSCSKGMRRKDGTLRCNPLQVPLTGCPLEEKISEAHLLKRGGHHLAALAMIMADNPMVPGTGHRICNDCMKGCIYQKAAPVDIPQIETNVLTEVLALPWGVEIYGLLTRWNPLNIERPHALPYNGRKVLVVGMGPAGYTLAHHLLNEGCCVVGIDALKIEPLPADLVGHGGKPPRPQRDYAALCEALDRRITGGFGGVAEYGITVRWDKNFLKLIHLTLARRHGFRCYGGVRFGGTLTAEDAWDLGFDHVALATGAGEPTMLNMGNKLLRGVRQASDFLMALQLAGAAKRGSMANLQVQLPAGIVGGGLTAIDTATEVMAYYPVQVEKTLERYEKVCERIGESHARAAYDEEERRILDEFLDHGRQVRAERLRARAEDRPPALGALVRRWGGVTIFYRKRLEDSPAYRQNHEEVRKALEEQVRVAPLMTPLEAVPDACGHLEAVRFECLDHVDGAFVSSGEQRTVPLRSLFVAAGTVPNIIYEREHPGSFEVEGRAYRPHALPDADGPLRPAGPAATCKDGPPAPFTSYRGGDGRHISFFGDNHPRYAGNVVKAMASARDGYPLIMQVLRHAPGEPDAGDGALATFQARMDDVFDATVQAVNRLASDIIEVVVHAPLAARRFEPGEFYRVQNYESEAPVMDGTVLASESLALTGASVDRERGLLSLIALEMGGSSRMCALWRPGQRIVVMGPTGAPTALPRGRTVVLVGGGLGNAVLFSIGRALRSRGNRVLYFAGYRKSAGLFKRQEIEAAADVVVWAVDPGANVRPIPTERPGDRNVVGDMLEAMLAYGRGELGEPEIRLDAADLLIVIGSDGLMEAVKEARHGVLAPYLKPGHRAIGSINSTMQCMMKGVCAQCLCRHQDPESGEESFVYSCFNQDQPLDQVDFEHLHARLRQNSVQEKLANQWLDRLLESGDPH